MDNSEDRIAASALAASAVPFMAIANPRDAAVGAGGVGVPRIDDPHPQASRSAVHLPESVSQPLPQGNATAPLEPTVSRSSAQTGTGEAPSRRARIGSTASQLPGARQLMSLSRYRLRAPSLPTATTNGNAVAAKPHEPTRPAPPPPTSFKPPPASYSAPVEVSPTAFRPRRTSQPDPVLASTPPTPAEPMGASTEPDPDLSTESPGHAPHVTTDAPIDPVTTHTRHANASIHQALYSFQLLEAIRGNSDSLHVAVASAPTEWPLNELISPLHLAVRSAPLTSVRRVLALRPADLNAPDANAGNTPLHLASSLGRADVVNTFLAQPQANVTIRNNLGQTPAELAASSAVGQEFWTVYTRVQSQLQTVSQAYADQPRDPHVRKHLLSLLALPIMAELDLDRPLNKARGGTLLHVASAQGDVGVVKAAGQAGANVYIRNSSGQPPASLATSASVRVLLDQMGSAHWSLSPSEGSIEAVPDAQLAVPMVRGYLSKFFGFPQRRFKSRWFVLSQGVLAYYTDPADEPGPTLNSTPSQMVQAIAEACAGCIDVRSSHILADPVDGTRFHVRGVHPIKHSAVRLTLRCNHASDRARWIHALRQAQVAHPAAPAQLFDHSSASPAPSVRAPGQTSRTLSSAFSKLPGTTNPSTPNPANDIAAEKMERTISAGSSGPDESTSMAFVPPPSVAGWSIGSASQPILPFAGVKDGPSPHTLPSFPRTPPRTALAPSKSAASFTQPLTNGKWGQSTSSLNMRRTTELGEISGETEANEALPPVSNGLSGLINSGQPNGTRRGSAATSSYAPTYGRATPWSSLSSGSDAPPRVANAIKGRNGSAGWSPHPLSDGEAPRRASEVDATDARANLTPTTSQDLPSISASPDVPHTADYPLISSALTTRSALAEDLAQALIQASFNLPPDTTLTATAQALASDVASLRTLLQSHLSMARDREAFYAQRYAQEVNARHLWANNLKLLAQQYDTVESALRERESQDATRRATVRRLHQSLRRVGGGLASLPTPSGPPSQAQSKLEGAAGADGKSAPNGTAQPLVPADVLQDLQRLSTDDPGAPEDEFHDAVELGLVPTGPAQPEPEPLPEIDPQLIAAKGVKDAFGPYEHLRNALPLDADQRPHLSLWSVLKNNIGKDLTKISFPVSFNEPTSMLQRMAEDMEFASCLDRGAATQDLTLRIAFVAAFAMSNYSSTIGRIAKPFNPLLSETFEYVSVEGQYRYYSEQVSHHPPVSACFAESPRWEYFGSVDAQNRFTGRTFEIRPTGMAHAHLKVPLTWVTPASPLSEGQQPTQVPHGHQAHVAMAPPKPVGAMDQRMGLDESWVLEHYTWNKVTTCVSGFLLGQTTIDHYGDMEVVNHHTGDRCVLTFKPRGWRGKDAFRITGAVYDNTGAIRWDIAGKWSDKLVARPHGQPNADAVVLWTNSFKPPAAFNLPPYAATLNDLPDGLYDWLPPTDARLRPDLRAFESGAFDAADGLKYELEQLQRSRRKEVEMGLCPPHRPRWFERSTDPHSKTLLWRPLFAPPQDAKPDTLGRRLSRHSLHGVEGPDAGTTAYWTERERSGHIKGLYHHSPADLKQADGGQAWQDVEPIFGPHTYRPGKNQF